MRGGGFVSIAGLIFLEIYSLTQKYTIFLSISHRRNLSAPVHFIRSVSLRNKTGFDISSGTRIIPSLITRLANNSGIINLRFTMPGELKIPSLCRLRGDHPVHANPSFLPLPSLNPHYGMEVEENRINIRESSEEDSFFLRFLVSFFTDILSSTHRAN